MNIIRWIINKRKEQKERAEEIKEFLPPFAIKAARVISYMVYFSWVLATVFILSKLIGSIHWPWSEVLCPIWIGLSLALVFSFILALAIGKAYTE